MNLIKINSDIMALDIKFVYDYIEKEGVKKISLVFLDEDDLVRKKLSFSVSIMRRDYGKETYSIHSGKGYIYKSNERTYSRRYETLMDVPEKYLPYFDALRTKFHEVTKLGLYHFEGGIIIKFKAYEV